MNEIIVPVAPAMAVHAVPGFGEARRCVIERIIWSAVFQEEGRGRAVPREGIRSAHRRRLLVYNSPYAKASEPVTFSLMLPESEG